MNFGENNMFCLNNQTKEEHENNIDVNVWYSSWEATTTIPITSPNSSFNNTTTAAERYSSGGQHRHQQQLYGGEGCHVQGDPHLTCLHLGKRHYFEDTIITNGDDVNSNNNKLMGNGHVCGGGAGFVLEGDDKRARGYSYNGGGGGKTAAFGTVPRCQVEGCHVALLNAKEYHRRHRVCDMHSKAPKVVVLGLDQRFCQQCSRFHVVSEFDDSKRSCRRRLAGHNERRRKSSHLSVTRSTRQEGCALSLLSSTGSDSWLSHHVDLSTRCSAALRELIAENRAALITRQQQQPQHQQQQLVYDRDWHVMTHHDAVEEQDFQELQPQTNYFPLQRMFPQAQ